MHPRCPLLSGRVSTTGVATRSAQSAQRTYATSAPTPAVKNPLQRRRGGDLGSHLPKHVIPKDAYIPAYPYGDHQLFKQANRGLYAHQMIQFGNNVSEKTETKTRRDWKPNVLSKSLYSVALKKRIKLRITAKVLKTMDREGGLDEYLLKDNVARIKELGPMGWALRWTLMQKPEVIERLRGEAAALGLDQAAIDKQWPTPQMMAEQRAARVALAQEVYTGGLENEEFAETEEQEMWDPEDASTPESEPAVTKRGSEAAFEYARAIKAAQRYLNRGMVDSAEEGLKLAFVRAKERADAASRLNQNFTAKVEAQFTPQQLEKIRTKHDLPLAKKMTVALIAYNQIRRQQISEAGGYEAWQAAKGKTDKIAAHAARVEKAGGLEAFQARKKAEYAKLIEEAETASTNAALDPERRSFLEDAIKKADRAIKAKAAGGKNAYVESTLEEFRQGQPSGDLDEIFQASKKEKKAGGDAWGALVNSSNKPAESRPNA